jgi:hypothetical protein
MKQKYFAVFLAYDPDMDRWPFQFIGVFTSEEKADNVIDLYMSEAKKLGVYLKPLEYNYFHIRPFYLDRLFAATLNPEEMLPIE